MQSQGIVKGANIVIQWRSFVSLGAESGYMSVVLWVGRFGVTRISFIDCFGWMNPIAGAVDFCSAVPRIRDQSFFMITTVSTWGLSKLTFERAVESRL